MIKGNETPNLFHSVCPHPRSPAVVNMKQKQAGITLIQGKYKYVPVNKELFKQTFYILTQIPLIIPSRYKGKELIILFLHEILS